MQVTLSTTRKTPCLKAHNALRMPVCGCVTLEVDHISLSRLALVTQVHI